MNNEFTERLQQWMNTPDEQKDWAEGAIMLLQLSGNKIMYANISVNPKGKAEFIKGKLQQYLNFRLQDLTKKQVKEMQQKVDVIAKDTIKPDGDFADFKAGKRADHDTLPDEIKALYVENLDIVHRMRELHLKLRTLSLEDATCPDSERYPFLKEIISLDKRLHENWDTYDHFVGNGSAVGNAAAVINEQEHSEAEQTAAEAADADSQSGSDAQNEQPETTEQAADAAKAEAAPVAETEAKAKRTTKRTAKAKAE